MWLKLFLLPILKFCEKILKIRSSNSNINQLQLNRAANRKRLVYGFIFSVKYQRVEKKKKEGEKKKKTKRRFAGRKLPVASRDVISVVENKNSGVGVEDSLVLSLRKVFKKWCNNSPNLERRRLLG